MLKLANEDRARLIGLLERLEELDTEDERRNALMSAGLGELVPKVDLSGSPEGAVARIVDFLAQHGRVAPEREALELFIVWAKGVTGLEQQRALEDILARTKQGGAGEDPPPRAPEPRPARPVDVPLAIGSAIAALAGLALVIWTFAGADATGAANLPRPRPEHRSDAFELIDDPHLRALLGGEVELPPDWPGWTRVVRFTPRAIAGARAITASGRTIRLFDVRPDPRAPDELALRVPGGDRIEITYDEGKLACFIPSDAKARIEDVAADPAIQSIEYKIGYVRSTWVGRGAVRACLGYDDRAFITPSTIHAGLRIKVPEKHDVHLVSVDGTHPMPCHDLSLLRIVTMGQQIPDDFLGGIPINTSWVDQLQRDKSLGVTCERAETTREYDKLDCTITEASFECHPHQPGQ